MRGGRQFDGPDDAHGLVDRLLEFRGGIRIGHDAGTGLNMGHFSPEQHRPEGDAGIQAPVESR